jgi:hypothetical protein
MFNVLCIFTLLLATVNATYIPRTFMTRASHPKGWLVSYLEDYQTYHIRYLALGCQYQHGKPFFDQCCHPMLATETLATARGPQCVPSPSASASASAVEPTSTVTTPGDDGGDCVDDGSESSSSVPSSTPPVSAPVSTPAPGPVANAGADPKPETTSSPEPETSSTPKPEPTTSSSPSPAPSPAPQTSSFLGFGTFFFQNGVAGACGKVNPDSALIAAIDIERYGDTGKQSPLCGKKVKITNTANQKSVVVAIADACPTCNTGDSIDLSKGAFDQIAEESTGLIKISWQFV